MSGNNKPRLVMGDVASPARHWDRRDLPSPNLEFFTGNKCYSKSDCYGDEFDWNGSINCLRCLTGYGEHGTIESLVLDCEVYVW